METVDKLCLCGAVPGEPVQQALARGLAPSCGQNRKHTSKCPQSRQYRSGHDARRWMKHRAALLHPGHIRELSGNLKIPVPEHIPNESARSSAMGPQAPEI